LGVLGRGSATGGRLGGGSGRGRRRGALDGDRSHLRGRESGDGSSGLSGDGGGGGGGLDYRRGRGRRLGASRRNSADPELARNCDRGDSSAGGDVGRSGLAVHVEDDAFVRVGVVLEEVDPGRERDGAGGDDLELDAVHVELSAAGGVGGERDVALVERDDLRAEQVLAGLEVRDGDGDVTLGGDELVGSLYAGWLGENHVSKRRLRTQSSVKPWLKSLTQTLPSPLEAVGAT
jgi:hypothetical protein